jgi:hypothetical protein
MSDLIQGLRPREQRGSKPRCHLLTHGPANEVSARLTTLAAPFATVSGEDRWMPQGFIDHEEAQLHRAARLVTPAIGDKLKSWWLAPASESGRTPNFDIASTCTIDGASGLLLVEAKAHGKELNKQAAGRLIKPDSSEDRKASHRKIGAAIDEARSGLDQMTSLPWKISRDRCYQMSNRFAWAWKLAELGIPVVMIYLGFLRADEMRDQGQPFADPDAWERLVRAHSAPLFPTQVWGQKWGTPPFMIVPLIRSLEISLGIPA